MIGLNDSHAINSNSSCLNRRVCCCFLLSTSATWFCHTIAVAVVNNKKKNRAKFYRKLRPISIHAETAWHIDLSMHFWQNVQSIRCRCSLWIIYYVAGVPKIDAISHISIPHAMHDHYRISIRTDLIFESLSFAARTLQYWRIFQTRYDNDCNDGLWGVCERARARPSCCCRYRVKATTLCAVWCIEMNGMSLPSCENTLTRGHRDTPWHRRSRHTKLESDSEIVCGQWVRK